jgi:DnaK suppressor protein
MKLVKPNLTAIKKYLEGRKRELEKRSKSLSEEDPFNDIERLSDNAASDTEAREEIGHERVEALKEELTGQLARVKQALAKIGIGKYGVCDMCGKSIEQKRLKVFPMANYCLSCDRELESKKR